MAPLSLAGACSLQRVHASFISQAQYKLKEVVTVKHDKQKIAMYERV